MYPLNRLFPFFLVIQDFFLLHVGGRMENIFSQEFNEFSGELLMTALKSLDVATKQKDLDVPNNGSTGNPKSTSSFSNFITSVATFINGGSLSGDAGADAERAEKEKVVQYLTFITEKMSGMFELDHVLKQFKTFPPSHSSDHQVRLIEILCLSF